MGVQRSALSVVARSHEEQGELAEAMDATPGAEIEDSRRASRLGELSAVLIGAAATVMPGVAPHIAIGPLAAEFGEAAGHLAGSVSGILERAGVETKVAEKWEHAVADGAILLGVHEAGSRVEAICEALAACGAREVAVAEWPDSTP